MYGISTYSASVKMCGILHSTPTMPFPSVTATIHLVTAIDHSSRLMLPTDSHASYSGSVWREWRTVLGAKSKLLYSEMALCRKPFGIGHTYMYTFLLRMTDTMTSQNIDISSWDTLCKSSCDEPSCRTYWDHIPQQYKPSVRVRTRMSLVQVR